MLKNPSSVLSSVAQKLLISPLGGIRPSTRSLSPRPCSWEIATGTAGWALFFQRMHLLFPQQGWDTEADRYLGQTLLSLDETSAAIPLPLGLFTGLTGVCLLVQSFCLKDAAYTVVLEKLQQVLFQLTLQRYPHLELPTLKQAGVSFRAYDIINGPAGIGTYALQHNSVIGAQQVIDLLVERLIFLSQPSQRVPGHLCYFIHPEHAPYQTFAETYPHGATDLGLAHGVPGPLSFLALAMLHGVQQQGLAAAIIHLSSWICSHQQKGTWPYILPLQSGVPSPGKPVWCYGATGVAWSLWLAGLALQDGSLQQEAIDIMEGIYHLFLQEQEISPILCHGTAGILQVVRGFACTSEHSLFPKMQSLLLSQLLESFDDATLYGFLERRGSSQPLLCTDFLEGVLGIALAMFPVNISDLLDTDPLFPLFCLSDHAFLMSDRVMGRRCVL